MTAVCNRTALFPSENDNYRHLRRPQNCSQ